MSFATCFGAIGQQRSNEAHFWPYIGADVGLRVQSCDGVYKAYGYWSLRRFPPFLSNFFALRFVVAILPPGIS